MAVLVAAVRAGDYSDSLANHPLGNRWLAMAFAFLSATAPTAGSTAAASPGAASPSAASPSAASRSEEHTSELQSPDHLVCRLLLEKKKRINYNNIVCGANFSHV